MKCILCNASLTRRSYYHWEINGKRSVSYECTNAGCAYTTGSLARCVVQITEPDNVITYYLFRYFVNGKQYRIRGYNETKPYTILQMISANKMDDEILNIPRFTLLETTDDLATKIQEIHKKLQPLIIFT